VEAIKQNNYITKGNQYREAPAIFLKGGW